MNKTNFWNDAARYGAVIGGVQVLFQLAHILVTQLIGIENVAAKGSLLLVVLNVAGIALFIFLLMKFTRRRAVACADAETGYSYGRCLGFILAMMLFAGILVAAWEILSRNVLFVDYNKRLLAEALKAVASMKSVTAAYGGDVLQMTRQSFFSPLAILTTSVFGMVIQGGFFGLFVSMAAKQEPNIFQNK